MYRSFFIPFLFLVFGGFAVSLQAEEVELQVILKNGTKGGEGSAEKVRAFALEKQMIPLSVGEIGPVRGSFRLPKVEAPNGLPILLQVTYGGVNYNKIVPPVPMMRAQPQEITVYEKTQDRSAIKTKSLLQITRSKDALIAFKVFILHNNSIPPRSFQNDADPIEIFVPSEATDVSAQLTQGAGMGIPLQLRPGKQGWILDRPILPGTSQLYVSYSIPANNLASVTFKDKLLFEKNDGERVVFAKPKDMELSFVGAKNLKKLEADVPEDVKAYSVAYSAPRQEVTISVSGGKAVESFSSDQERNIENGKIFVSAEKTLLGVVAVLGLLFTLSFLFAYRKLP
ncbi:hypothetical protein EHO60_09135 [Leptospira fletcheri]|uniref:Uncharacterized protein n=1 Tax=Leptospira fletcheri TaxID=2484981 RepID=A0A4R9GIF0_9LEPT|nr:hypothetical protein [Leptospira fletcheri]TGK12399.1 hypothetical protein EHO60_09135 [Leptospira fletcheri]